VDHLVLLPFDPDVAQMSPQEWVERFLTAGLRPAGVVVGEDFRFGHRRCGDTATLGALLAEVGTRFESVSLLTDATGSKLGSSAVRAALSRGDVDDAASQLGYLHTVDGLVVQGARRGRTLGFPTANVAATGLRPSPGVYAGWATRLSDDGHTELETWPAAINVGSNPTFANATTTGVEVHLLDADLGPDALYDHTLTVAFAARLRDERRFESADALRAAIATDVAGVHPTLATVPHPRTPPRIRTEAPRTRSETGS
jgi:riboflavin kinase/FMN adenylyltransferase